MTPEEVREARRILAKLAVTPGLGLSSNDRRLVTGYARELERRAEAMAAELDWIGNESQFFDAAKRTARYALAVHRTQFPRTDEDGR
jgi:hypothetical protein